MDVEQAQDGAVRAVANTRAAVLIGVTLAVAVGLSAQVLAPERTAAPPAVALAESPTSPGATSTVPVPASAPVVDAGPVGTPAAPATPAPTPAASAPAAAATVAPQGAAPAAAPTRSTAPATTPTAGPPMPVPAPSAPAPSTTPPTTAQAPSNTTPATQSHTYAFEGVAAEIVILQTGGSLSAGPVTPEAGWTHRVEKNGPRTVKIEFRRTAGEGEAVFEVVLEGGRLVVHQEGD